jgi:AraC-like DNA-binding protein
VPYVEFPPRPALAGLVKCVWNYEANAHETASRFERIVPDGNPEFIVHHGTPFTVVTPERVRTILPRAFMMGQMTRPIAFDPNHGTPRIVGVRFHPAGARAIFGAAMDEFTDNPVELMDLAPRSTPALIDRLASAASPPLRAAIVEDFVAGCADRHARFRDEAVHRWTARLACTKGALSVTELAKEAGLSSRQVERRFLAQVGISPQRYANVIRFRSVFNLLTSRAQPDWATVAASAGYFDQSHMIRDFQRFLGCPPSAFLNQRRGLSPDRVELEAQTTCRVVTNPLQ